MYKRLIKDKVLTALSDTPVVLINGPRQSGKTTFVQELKKQWKYITFDDPANVDAALYDPNGFINKLPEHVILDEVQRVPEIFSTIKMSVDNNRIPGRFLMTGSANILTLPKLSDSLAGRIEAIPLYPLSLNEIKSSNKNFITRLLGDKLEDPKGGKLGSSLYEYVVTGGYPEAITRKKEARIKRWHKQYIDTLIQRDVKEISSIQHLESLPKLLSSLANHSGQLLDKSNLAASVGVSRTTINRMVNLLKSIFLLNELVPWSTNRHSRLVKMPKSHLTDTGLICAMLNVGTTQLEDDKKLFGHILESFVFNELLRQSSHLEEFIDFFHYRDHDKKEVDIVIEVQNSLIGIEVKAAETVRKKDFSGLETFRNRVPKKFKHGLIFYDGDRILSFGGGMLAVPISCLWS